ncbi:Mitochondrial inner membrane protein OXA1L [Camponotus floridanus]|uniref:Mitochondrial inner membrane protein OXA1L n=1 Tax=Camponotus floridanus TaxID=104421 RepID=E2A4W7_CAMFO|nr:mitochondrial inner membrane protein OXA1L [Camponotus floridanus]EFN71509.1 Mitochondrial inner membrane protein OXA1L [Camponotus floridanus]
MLVRVSAIACRQALLKTHVISQEVITCRHIHLINQIKGTSRTNSVLNLYKNCKNCRITGIPLVRYASTNETPQKSPYDEIPDPPTPVEEIIENIVKVHPNGEATLESIGLASSYTPVGLIQKFLEFMHISCDIPWWTTIVIGTICVRVLIFPIVIKAQKNMINFSNCMPVITELQMKMTEARQNGDHFESARIANEMMQYMKKNDVSPVKNFIVPLIQAPVFLSFFLALRGMANTPVESLKYGGFWWLHDLTVHDPYYIMPIVTSVTMYITIELGADGTNLKSMGMFRYVLRAVPFIILPFMIHFPGAILTYWVSTNFVSLVQTGILKVPYVRKTLDMPTRIKHKSAADGKKKNFTKEFQEAWTNMKISKQLADRERADTVQFNAAGKGPLVKTFKYDPTKQKKQSTVLTKSR